MDAQPSLPLTDRLQAVAALWIDAHPEPRPSLARLGRQVVNDGGFFTRFETNPAADTTTGTLAKFAAWLGDAANWPDGTVPEEAKAFAHVTGVAVPASRAA